MSDTDASALLELIAGKHRSNQVSSILGNMAEANELLNSSLNAAGTASNEYQIYLDSAKASTERFGVAMTETYNNVINGETVKGLTNAGTAVLDFANSCGILEGTLKGFLALGILKGITTLSVAFKNSAVQAGNFGTALSTVKDMSLMVRGTTDYTIALKTLKSVSLGLSETQLKQVLASETLSESERIAILRTTGLTKAQAQAKLAQMGLTQSTNAQTTANASVTASTFSLTAAVKGFGASVKTAFLSNPIGMIMLGISTAIGVFSSAISKSNQKVEEARQKAKESADAYKETSSSMDDYISKYSELRKQLIAAKGNEEETYNVKKQMLDLQTELNEKYGEEHGCLNLVTDAYKDQTKAIKELNKESANKFLNENRGGIEEAANKMESDNTYHLGTMNGMVNADELNLLDKIKKIADSNGIDFTDKGFQFVGGAEEASESIDNFMDEIKLLQKDSDDVSEVMASIFDGLLDNSGDALSDANNIINKYQETYNQAKMAQIASDDNLSEGYDKAVSAVEAYNEAVLRSEDPYNDENVNKAWNDLQTVKQGIQENKAEWGKYSSVMEDVFSAANDDVYSFYQALQDDTEITKLAGKLKGLSDVDLQAMADDGSNGDAFDILYEKAKEYGIITDDNAEGIQEVLELLAEWGILQKDISETELSEPPSYKSSLDGVQSLSDNLKTLMEVYDDVQDGEEFDWSSILNNEEFEKVFGGAGKVYDDFIKTVTKNPDDITACQKAFDSLATSLIDNSGIWDNLTAETEKATVAMLEENGVVNAAELVAARLALQEEWLALAKDNTALAGRKLSDVTWEEIGALLHENEEAASTSQSIAALALEKMDLNNTVIDTTDDVNQIVAIANAAGASTAYIQALAKALVNFKSMQFDTNTLGGKVGNAARNVAVNAFENGLKSALSAELENAKLDASQFYAKSGGTGGSGKSGKSGSGKSGSDKEAKESIEVFDFIEIAISRVEKAIERLKTRAEETFRSFTSRGREYQKAISEITKEIDIQRQGYEKYIARANSIGLEEPWAKQVRDGNINIADVADDGLKERIKNYKEWWNRATLFSNG